MITREQYLSAFRRIINATETIFRLVPEDKLAWAPREGMLTCGQQMIHMAGALSFYVTGLKKGEWPIKTLDEILKTNHDAPSASAALAIRVMRRAFQDVQTMVNGFTDNELAEMIHSPQFGREVPRWQLLILLMEHHLTHKTELFMYLRILGITVGTRQLYADPSG